jgi:GNAT superfamily N-acetyltransferase
VHCIDAVCQKKGEKVKSALKYSESYRKRVRMTGGAQANLRLVRPSDKALLENGFNNLSSLSRHKRFFAGKHHLSQSELRYFTELDQDNHFALGVVELNNRGEEVEGIGIGRFIRLETSSNTAEVALTVIDRMQGKGIGRLLLTNLIAAAAERGVTKFRFECLPHNRQMQNLVRNFFPIVNYEKEDGVMIAEADTGTLHAVPDAITLPGFFDFGRLWGELTAEVLLMHIRIGSEIANRTWYKPLNRAYAGEPGVPIPPGRNFIKESALYLLPGQPVH